MRGIDVGYRYGVSGTGVRGEGGAMALNLTVKAGGDSGWSRGFELVAPSALNGTEASARAHIDLAPLQAMIETIEKETGYTPSSYELTVVGRVDARATVAGEAVKLDYAPALTFKYTRTTITADPQLQQPSPKTLGDSVTRDRELSLAGLGLAVSTARPLSAALAVLALAAAGGFAAVVFLGLGQDETVKAQVRYHTTMVKVEEADHNGSQRVRVGTIGDLARLAQRDGGVIFAQKVEDGDLYFVPDGPVTYEYSAVNGNGQAAPPANGATPAPAKKARARRNGNGA